jgi:hypothetical protein
MIRKFKLSLFETFTLFLIAELINLSKTMEIIDLISDSEEEVLESPQIEAENDEEIDGGKNFFLIYFKCSFSCLFLYFTKILYSILIAKGKKINENRTKQQLQLQHR